MKRYIVSGFQSRFKLNTSNLYVTLNTEILARMVHFMLTTFCLYSGLRSMKSLDWVSSQTKWILILAFLYSAYQKELWKNWHGILILALSTRGRVLQNTWTLMLSQFRFDFIDWICFVICLLLQCFQWHENSPVKQKPRVVFSSAANSSQQSL